MHNNPNINAEAPLLHAGMPPLDESAARTSWFEFAPAHLFYTPIALYCGLLSLRHRGLTLPTGTNPALPYSGLVGESKFEVLSHAWPTSKDWISPYVRILRWGGDGGMVRTLEDASNALKEAGIDFPLVAKPDIGMRGAGVQLVHNEAELELYLQAFPAGANLLLQKLVDMEGEAGVFYVRHPDEKKGRIISLTLKYFPRVTGDGKSTLRQLIMADPRAGKLAHLYLARHRDRLDEVITVGESIRLAFAGNHCRGTIFRNGNNEITQAMTERFDQIAQSMEGFFIGRFDVRFADFNRFQAGEGFRIIEINGAGGEATHIWDSRTTLREAYKTLMHQFGHLYAIGAKNRKRGHKPTPLQKLIKAWWREKRLTKHYPITH